MQVTQVTVTNADDREFELATLVVQTASQFGSSIHVSIDGKTVNAKSIMGMTYLALTDDDIVQIMAEGSDEEAALNALTTLLEK